LNMIVSVALGGSDLLALLLHSAQPENYFTLL
jgi:hypothetical protein